jgi:hypothetical protein
MCLIVTPFRHASWFVRECDASHTNSSCLFLQLQSGLDLCMATSQYGSQTRQNALQAAHARCVGSPVGNPVWISLLVYKHLDLHVHTSFLLSYILDTLSPALQTHLIDLHQSSLIVLSSLQSWALLRSTHHFDCCITSVVTLPKLLLSN